MKRDSLTPEALELVAARFRILGEPMRLRMLAALESGERNVTELVNATDATQANVSRHLQTLADAGIVGRRKEGLNVYYFIADPGIFELCDSVCGSLRKRFDAQARAFGARA
jgi:DNA-binding transcriptional ArsR family regulator